MTSDQKMIIVSVSSYFLFISVKARPTLVSAPNIYCNPYLRYVKNTVMGSIAEFISKDIFPSFETYTAIFLAICNTLVRSALVYKILFSEN